MGNNTLVVIGSALSLMAIDAAAVVIETPYGFGGYGPDIKAKFELEAIFTGVIENFDNTANSSFFSLPSSPGVTYQSNIGTTGSPISGVPVVGSYNPARAGTIVGTPFNGGSDDGRVGYEITFAVPQQYAGIQRIWNTETLTEFYNATGDLLFSQSGSYFIGFAADPLDSSTWVSRIQLDTTAPSNARQVGYSDDLVYGTGTLTIPEPRTYALMALGAAMIAGFCWRRKLKGKQFTESHK